MCSILHFGYILLPALLWKQTYIYYENELLGVHWNPWAGRECHFFCMCVCVTHILCLGAEKGTCLPESSLSDLVPEGLSVCMCAFVQLSQKSECVMVARNSLPGGVVPLTQVVPITSL